MNQIQKKYEESNERFLAIFRLSVPSIIIELNFTIPSLPTDKFKPHILYSFNYNLYDTEEREKTKFSYDILLGGSIRFTLESTNESVTRTIKPTF